MLTEPEAPADTEGGDAAMATTDEVENIEDAETSVRAAILGKGDRRIEREEDRSAMQSSPIRRYRIGTQGRSDPMEDEVGIEDGPARASGLRFPAPERNPGTKRDVEDEEDTVGKNHNNRRITENDAMDSIGMINKDERRTLNAAISGVDITEVYYSPVRVAAVAAKFGLTPGTSFDLTNSWDFRQDAHRTRIRTFIKTKRPLWHQRLAPVHHVQYFAWR